MTHPNAPRSSRRHFALSALAALAAFSFGTAQAQAPQIPKTVKMLIPFPPGGSTDLLGRAVGARLATQLGITVVIENKGGAAGSVGAGEFARMPTDGSALMMGHIGTLAINPSIYPKLPYDPIKSFAPVALVARVPNVLVVNERFPAKNFKEFIAKAKAEPGRLNYSSGGNGSAAHITMEFLKQETGVFMPHIPYRGAAPAISDVLGGQVETIFTGSPALIAHIRAGRLRALAVSSEKRMAQLPDVPTVAESGYPGFEADQWYGVVAPAGTPAAIVAFYNAEINKALSSPEMERALATEGAIPTPTTPKAFGDLIVREIPRWGKVIKAGNVKAD